MSTLIGVQTGTKIVVEIEDAPDSGTYTALPGETAHSLSRAFELIDISNKTDGDVRVFLEGEGRKLLDLTIEAINNTDPTYQLLDSNAEAFTFPRIRRVAGGKTIISKYGITAVSDNPTLNTGFANSYTLSSHGAISVT